MSRARQLKNLDLSKNELDGRIPTTLSALQSLVALNVSLNKLEGAIPQEVAACNLDTLNVATNALDGPIPPIVLHWKFVEGRSVDLAARASRCPTTSACSARR